MKYILVVYLLVLLLTIGNLIPVSAQNSVEGLKEKLELATEDSTRAKIYVTLFQISAAGAQPDAEEYAMKALECAKKSSYHRVVTAALSGLLRLHLKQGNTDKALSAIDELEDYALANDYEEGLAVAYNERGTVFYHRGLYADAVQAFMEASSYYEKIGDRMRTGFILNNIGTILEAKKNYDRALDYYYESLSIKREFNDTLAISKTLNNIGNLLVLTGKRDKALEHLNESLRLCTECSQNLPKAPVLFAIGNLYLRDNDYKKSLANFKEALEDDLEAGNMYGISSDRAGIAECYLGLGDYNSALEAIKKAISISEQSGFEDTKSRQLKVYSKILEKVGRFKESLGAYREYVRINDSLFTEENNRTIAELETRYQSEKKEKEIQALTQEREIDQLKIKRNENLYQFFIAVTVLTIIAALAIYRMYTSKRKSHELLEDKNEELILSNATKDKLFALIAHDLKNPLSAFRSLAGALSVNIENMTSQQIHYFVKEIHDSSEEVHNLLTNLLQWAMMQSDRLEYRPRKFMPAELVENNLKLFKNIANEKEICLKGDTDTTLMAYADPDMISTVIRNLVSNALRFTPHGGTVNIGIDHAEGKIRIRVEDSGIGISPEDQKKLFRIEVSSSEIGTSSEKGTGLGLILCRELTERNFGEISVRSNEGKGSVFTFTVPRYSIDFQNHNKAGTF